MTREEIKSRARAALARALKTDPAKITDEATHADLAAWDSVHHMNVIIALENDFNIEFDDAELAGLNSLPRLVDAVEKHLAAG